jgi:hypothetical protein
MTEQRSFRVSDFSLRDVPGFLVVYIIVAAICVLLGLFLEALPGFWRGLVVGAGLGLFAALVLLYPSKKIDIATLPEPSEKVKATCAEPGCSLVVAVKAYRDETGVSLHEATAVMKDYLSRTRKETQAETRG